MNMAGSNWMSKALGVGVVLCVLIGTSGLSEAAPVYNPATDHFYDRVDAALDEGHTWESAKLAAESMSYFGVQGHLAVVTSQGEQDFISANLNLPDIGLVQYWLGGYQPAGSPEPSGEWAWVTGEPWVYENWHSGEPNNSGGAENSLAFWYNDTWNDAGGETTYAYESPLDAHIEHGFVVEYPVPEPATAVIFSLAGLALLRRKRRESQIR